MVTVTFTLIFVLTPYFGPEGCAADKRKGRAFPLRPFASVSMMRLLYSARAATLAVVSDNLIPRTVTADILTTAIRAAMSPNSIALAILNSGMNFEIIFVTGYPLKRKKCFDFNIMNTVDLATSLAIVSEAAIKSK